MCESNRQADGGLVRMLALGPQTVLIGRAWAYALAGGGQQGVAHMRELLTAEIRVPMALTSVTFVGGIDRHILFRD